MSSPQTGFPLQVAEEDGRVTVRFPANTTLSEANAPEFERAMSALVEGKGHLHLFVDLGGITMLTSVILAKLVALNAALRDTGGRLTLFNPAPSVQQVFKVTRLDNFLDLHADAQPLPT